MCVFDKVLCDFWQVTQQIWFGCEGSCEGFTRVPIRVLEGDNGLGLAASVEFGLGIRVRCLGFEVVALRFRV